MALKSDIVTFYDVKSIHTGDIWLQFKNNEKNTPDGAALQNIKKILKQ